MHNVLQEFLLFVTRDTGDGDTSFFQTCVQNSRPCLYLTKKSEIDFIF